MLTKYRTLIAPPVDDSATVVFGLIACLLLLSAAMVADLDFSVAIFYAIPIALAAWLFGRWIGVGVTAFSVVATTSVAILAHHDAQTLPIFLAGLLLVGIISVGGSEWARQSDELVLELDLGDRKHRKIMDTVTKVGQELVTTKRIEVIAGLVMDSLVTVLEVDAAWVFEQNDDGDGPPMRLLAFRGIRPPGRSVDAPSQALEPAGILSYLELPVSVRGRLWGIVLVGTRKARTWTDEDRGVAISLVNQLGLAMENASAYRAAIQANVRLEEVSQLKSDFMRTVSHELRTPLTVLMGYMEMMSDGTLGQVPDQWDRPMAQVKLKVSELNRLVRMMLDASRSESPSLKLNLEDVEIGSLLELAVRAQEPEADEAGVELRLDAARRAVIVRCDRDKVMVAMRNLLENALKYSPPGAVVDVGLHDDEDAVKIWVADRGPGIPDAEKPRVFEQFYRVQRAGAEVVRGTGLGLYIVRMLSEAQGGSIAVEDRAGGGSIFTLSLPRAVQEQTA